MTPTSFAVPAPPVQAKLLNMVSVFLKRRKFATKCMYLT